MNVDEVLDAELRRFVALLFGVWLVAVTVKEPWAGIYLAFFVAPIAAGWYVYTHH